MLFVNPSDTFTEPFRSTFVRDVTTNTSLPQVTQSDASLSVPVPQHKPPSTVSTPSTAVSEPVKPKPSPSTGQKSYKQEPSKLTGSLLPPTIPPPESTMTPSRPVSQNQRSSGPSASPFNKTPQVVIPPLKDVQKSLSTKASSSKSPATAPHRVQKPTKTHPVDGDVDYQTLLLALADEYLSAAHSKGSALALSNNESESREYYRLVATGLGCLEAAQSVRLFVLYDICICGPFMLISSTVDAELSITPTYGGFDTATICAHSY